jgi:hypothetical protein
MPTSNAGFSPRELQRREFQATAAATLDRQAGVIGQVVEAINQTNEQARVSREFVADLSVRIDSIDDRIPPVSARRRTRKLA